MPSPSAIVIDTIQIPVVGRPVVTISLASQVGEKIDFYILQNAGDALTAALLHKDNDAIGGVTRESDTEVSLELSGAEAGTLSPQTLYSVVVQVANAEDVVYTQGMGYLLPVVVLTASIFTTTTGSSAFLSTRSVNTRTLSGVAGGAGYLDGITTLGQARNCVVQFLVDGDVQQWILEASTAATGPGRQRGLDYAAGTNEAVWRRIL